MELSLVGWKVSVLVRRAPEAQQLTLLSAEEREAMAREFGWKQLTQQLERERTFAQATVGQFNQA